MNREASSPKKGAKTKVSVVMPCLDEEETIGVCVDKCMEAFRRYGYDGEVVVADNGSTDRSVEIAESKGARVVHQPIPGYGSAYRKGFSEAQHEFIVIGDSDDTYDFLEMDKLVAKLEEGHEFVMGSRYMGGISEGAMPWMHRYFGNPFLSFLIRFLFGSRIHDSNCGMRAITKSCYEKLKLGTPGMEFASEMIIHAAKLKVDFAQVPIKLNVRGGGEPKLQTFRDGWRNLRFMLIHSPNYVFVIPGLVFFLIGLAPLLLLSGGPIEAGGLYFGSHYSVLGSLFTLTGYQALCFGVMARVYSQLNLFEEDDWVIRLVMKRYRMEHGLLASVIMFGGGLLLNIYILWQWIELGFTFQGSPKVGLAVAATTLMLLGVQTFLTSFFIGILGIKERKLMI